MRKLKNTNTTSHLHIDQCNTPSAVQISIVANEELKKASYGKNMIDLVLRDSGPCTDLLRGMC